MEWDELELGERVSRGLAAENHKLLIQRWAVISVRAEMALERAAYGELDDTSN